MEKFRQTDGKVQNELRDQPSFPPRTPPQQPTTPEPEEHIVKPSDQELVSESSVKLEDEEKAESQASSMYLMKVIKDAKADEKKEKEGSETMEPKNPVLGSCPLFLMKVIPDPEADKKRAKNGSEMMEPKTPVSASWPLFPMKVIPDPKADRKKEKKEMIKPMELKAPALEKQQKLADMVKPFEEELESVSSGSINDEEEKESQVSSLYMMKVIREATFLNDEKGNHPSEQFSGENSSNGTMISSEESEDSISLRDEEEKKKGSSGQRSSYEDESEERCLEHDADTQQKSEASSSMYLMKVIREEEEDDTSSQNTSEDGSISSSSDGEESKERLDLKWYEKENPKTALIYKHIDNLNFFITAKSMNQETSNKSSDVSVQSESAVGNGGSFSTESEQSEKDEHLTENMHNRAAVPRSSTDMASPPSKRACIANPPSSSPQNK